VDKIKMDLRERGWGGMGWIDLAQDREQLRALVKTVMNIWAPYNAGTLWSICTDCGLPSVAFDKQHHD
jgi:hypothetical protein